MKKNKVLFKFNRKIFISIFLFVNIIIIFSSHSDELSIPSNLFYYQPAASVFGAEAIWNNPAALSEFRVSGFQLMADYSDGYFGKSWGAVLNREGMGFAYRKLYRPDGDDFKEYIISVGSPLGQNLNFGISYHSIKNLTFTGNEYSDNNFWDISFSGKLNNKFKWGAVISNLNHTKVNNIKTDREMRYSIAYRPLGNKITLAADMFLSTTTKLSNADYIYHAKAELIPGLYLNGYIDDNNNFELGIRANILKYFTGGRRLSDKNNNHIQSTVFFGAIDQRQPSIIKSPKRRLSVKLSGRPQENPTRAIIGKNQPSFLSMLLNIYRAADDPAIAEMVISFNRLKLGFSQAQELREAILFFKNKDKKITCHISYPNNIAYYIASVCNEILIPPVSQLNLTGLKAELTFYGKTLEKIGIKIELLKIGKYKTATETFTQATSSDENKEQINRLLDNLYHQFVNGIAQGRNLSLDSVKTIIDNGPYTSDEAIQYGLVDGLSYKDEMTANFLTKMPEISYHKYISDTLVNDNWQTVPTLAIISASGEVAFSSNKFSFFNSPTDVTPNLMKKAFQKTRLDPNIKGIIFRIDSPGGVALAGDEIYHEVSKTAREKMVVSSFGNLAASGGYYIAMPASYIFANPSTITGSIGIYGGKADFSGLHDKLNIGKELYVRGKNAGMLTNIRPFSNQEKEKYLSHLNSMYQHFLTLVSENRNLSVDSIDNLGRGQVWTGEEALSNGLVDKLGGIKETLDFTADRLGLKDYRIKIYPQKKTLFNFPGANLFKSFFSIFVKNKNGDNLLKQIIPDESFGLFTRLPYDIVIE